MLSNFINNTANKIKIPWIIDHVVGLYLLTSKIVEPIAGAPHINVPNNKNVFILILIIKHITAKVITNIKTATLVKIIFLGVDLKIKPAATSKVIFPVKIP